MKKSSPKKHHVMHFRISDHLRAQLIAESDQREISTADVIRETLLNKYKNLEKLLMKKEESPA
jgi:hypothetical protein